MATSRHCFLKLGNELLEGMLLYEVRDVVNRRHFSKLSVTWPVTV